MHVHLLIFIFTTSSIVFVSGQDYIEEFEDPYRSARDNTVKNPTFTSMTSINSVAISYQGFAQARSDTPSSFRLLFTVQPASSSLYSLPKVYILNNQYLAANISTTIGTEMMIGPKIALDSWFSFGITIANGPSRYVLLYYSSMNSTQDSKTTRITPMGNMLPSSTAIIVAPTATPVALNPAPIYLSSLRIFGQALDSDTYDIGAWYFPPSTYAWEVGTELGILGFEHDVSTWNITCVGDEIVTSVTKAYWGRPIGVWPFITPNPICDLDHDEVMGAVRQSCLWQNSCLIPVSSNELHDPCPGNVKWIAISMTCSPPAQPPTLPPVSSVSSTFKPAPATIATPFPTMSSIPSSKTSSNWNSWQISLTIGLRTLGLTDTTRSSMITSFVNDMSLALNVDKARFSQVQFLQQTSSSTQLSFVILPDPIADPDATLLAGAFNQKIQTSGSDLRSGSLLVWASTPPVAVQMVGVRATSCGSNYVISPSQCPTSSSPSLSSSDSGMGFYSPLLFVAGVCLVMTAVCSVCCFWIRRKPRPAKTSVPVEAPYLPGQGVAVGVNNLHRPIIGIVDAQNIGHQGSILTPVMAGSFHMSNGAIVTPIVLPKDDNGAGRFNKARMERLQNGNRVKFAEKKSAGQNDDPTAL